MTARLFAFGVLGSGFLGVSACAFSSSLLIGLGTFALFMGALNLAVLTLEIEQEGRDT